MMEERQQYQPAPPANGKAIASLVLGILSIIIPWLGFILGIIGIVLANKAFKEIANYQQGGRGMAVAGLTTSIIGTAIWGLFILLIIFSFAAFSTYTY